MQKTIPREVQIAWLAGIFDGEGTLGLYFHEGGKAKNSQIYYHLSITNTDRRILAEAEDILTKSGVKFRETVHEYVSSPGALTFTKRKTCYKIEMKGTGKPNMLAFLKLVHPYLIGRKHQAKIMIDFFEKYPNLTRNYPDLPRSGRYKDVKRRAFYKVLIQEFKDARND